MKKISITVAIVLLIICGCTKVEIPEIEIGDYFEFGTYNDAPILWRVINVEENGDFLLFSDKIIDIKPFDAAGEYHIDQSTTLINREIGGSGNWEYSNIRQWLNSDGNIGDIKWLQNRPSNDNVFCGFSPYDMEAGFLATEHFKINDLNLIKKVTHKTLLHEMDFHQKDGGEGRYIGTTTIYDDFKKYDAAAYKMITDRIFLLSVYEAYSYLYLNRGLLGDEYYIGYPTKNIIDMYKSNLGHSFSSNNPWSYLLRTPSGVEESAVKYIAGNGEVHNIYASFGTHCGIRPALVIDRSQLKSFKGEGTIDIPFKI